MTVATIAETYLKSRYPASDTHGEAGIDSLEMLRFLAHSSRFPAMAVENLEAYRL
jgi:hypothetical protein